MRFYKSSRGEDVVKNLIYNLAKNDIRKIVLALDKLSNRNTTGLDIKVFRKTPIFELKVGKHRIFYVEKSGDIVIIHFLRKDSGKIRNVDVDIVLKRAKEILNK